ncbi:glycosyltransferase [Halioglobus sp.]|nr:glycosyltransferase [Halioglobus sp.]
MKLSIVLATYNGAKYLADQLQSYLDQDRMPDELVVSDDCSTDETCSLIDTFAEVAPFDVHVVRQAEQVGYVRNFDRALHMATGDLIFLSDQDDFWLPEKISEISTLMEKNPEFLVVLNDAAITRNDLSPTGLTKLGQLRSTGSPDSAFVMGCCCAMRREFLDLSLPIPEGAKGHDNWLVNFSNGLNTTAIVEKVLQLYRRHELNESSVIANSLRRVNRMDRLKRQITRAFSREADNLAESEISHIEQLQSLCRRALGNCGGKYDAKIIQYAARLEREVEMLYLRRELRRTALYIRVFKAPSIWMSGGYREANGLKSMFRDLIG